jgi:L-ribulose-5-phosphate 3-epimerase
MVSAKNLNRRGFLKKSVTGAAGAALLTRSEGFINYSVDEKPKYPLRLSACCSSFGEARTKLEAVEAAYKSGLDGISMRYLYDLNNPEALRHKNMQHAFREASLQYGVQINSLMVGGLIRADPASSVWVMDSIECARNLGAGVILLALLRNGFPGTDDEYKLLIGTLKELGHKAADEGITIGLECSGSAQEQMRIIDGVNLPSVKIYYDYFNAMHFGYEPLEEIPVIGEHICEYHVKNGPKLMREDLKGTPKGSSPGETYPELNHPKIAKEIQKTGYKGWLTFETSSPSKNHIADMQDNVAYSRKVFSILM